MNDPAQSPQASRWLSWLVGVALISAVCIAALHFSEAEEIARVAERAQPWWLAVALVLQAATYLAQGEIWRVIGKAAGFSLSRAHASRLSLAKLFVDQAIPTAGVSGTAAVARHLEQAGMPTPAVRAAVVINLTSYFTTYVILLVLALVWLPLSGPAFAAVVGASAVFIAGSVAVLVVLFRVPGKAGGRLSRRVERIKPLRALVEASAGTDVRLARSGTLFAKACAAQVAIMLLDAATVWVLVRALGSHASMIGVFASFMISNLFRTLGVLPGGLGTFEASSVVTLGLVGIALPVALSATLLFRGLSFWLPMIPGLWLSRRLFRAAASRAQSAQLDDYWTGTPESLLAQLGSAQQGLSAPEAAERLRQYGLNRLSEEGSLSHIEILLRQLASPLQLLLVFAAIVAAATGEVTNAIIVLTILGASAYISYRREYSARAAAAALRERVKVRTTVIRDGAKCSVPAEEIVPGDIVLLSAGSLVPADSRVLEATDSYVSESVLTGESFPVEKSPSCLPADTPLPQRSNCVYLGTNVRSGTLRCVAVRTGSATMFGTIAQRLTLRPPETEFDRGTRRFGYMLTSAMLVMVLIVFVAHMLAARPVVETLLFAVALAVGLSPELLPAILSVNLARGAQMMAQHGVLVRRLNAIENLGSIDVLCTDKTGTLTEGVVRLDGGYDSSGAPSQDIVELGALNATFESGLASPLDDAILASCKPDLAAVTKLAEIPFDFVRKRVSVVVERAGDIQLVSKGAFRTVLDACTTLVDGTMLDDPARAALEAHYARWSGAGIRVIAVATKLLPRQAGYDRTDESGLRFAGFLTFLDRPKQDVPRAIADLCRLGVSVKLITGDSRLVAEHVAGLVGLGTDRVLTGAQLDELHDEALWREAERTDLFVEVDPNQKERIILSLKKMGHVVGFLGDGVNDAPAMHAADTSISVEHAVDVAREAADFVLVQQDLDVIRRGIEEGRRTFANTLKYVLTTTSANLGNMVSMAAASLFLPFLPLTAGQILLNNFMSDIPALGIADDSVDPELIDRPRRWDTGFIGRYMVEFGLVSSLFDFLTFGILLWGFRAAPAEFQTTWFVESLLTELVIAVVIRTRRPFFRSRPGTLLLSLTVAIAVITPLLPYLPFMSVFGFVPVPWTLTATVIAITVLYVAAVEVTKRWFYRSR